MDYSRQRWAFIFAWLNWNFPPYVGTFSTWWDTITRSARSWMVRRSIGALTRRDQSLLALFRHFLPKAQYQKSKSFSCP